jgi:heme-degrading monooxygenase HmoA
VSYRSILYMKAAPGRRDELVAAFRRLEVLETASRQAGFVESTVHLSLDDPDELMVIATWATRDDYAGWLASPARARLSAEVPELIAENGPAGRVFEVVHHVHA